MPADPLGPPGAGPASTRWALAVADAGWFTTENLFREVDPGRARTLLLRCSDYRVAWAQGERPWSWNRPTSAESASTFRRDLVLPTGWMKSFPRLGMRPIARAIREWKRDHAPGDPTALVMTYPFYLHLARMVRPDVTVYLNLDDYRLYWPKSAALVDRAERAAVLASDLTFCTARFRVDELRAAIPEAASKIHHLPHGAPTRSIPAEAQVTPAAPPDDLATIPRPILGYVGTMDDRVDWPMMDQLAGAVPEASVVLVGRVGSETSGEWPDARSRCLDRPNVHAVGWRPQGEIDRYNRCFDVGLIPYRVDHPFNRSCCPTKVMDYMATGRPVVSTDLPECRLHADLFDVVPPARFVDAVRSKLALGPVDPSSEARRRFALDHSCRAMADRLLDGIDQVHAEKKAESRKNPV